MNINTVWNPDETVLLIDVPLTKEDFRVIEMALKEEFKGGKILGNRFLTLTGAPRHTETSLLMLASIVRTLDFFFKRRVYGSCVSNTGSLVYFTGLSLSFNTSRKVDTLGCWHYWTCSEDIDVLTVVELIKYTETLINKEVSHD